MTSLVSIADALVDAEVFTDGDWVESKDQDPDGDVRLTQLADVGDGSWIDKSARFLTSEKAEQLRCTYLEPGDLLIVRMPDPLGRCCVFPGDPMPCVTAVDVCVIRPNQQKIDNRYLMHVINSPVGRQGIASHITGTTRQRISRKNLGKVVIPLPPLAEQKRIAGILDAADALRAKRRESLAQLDTLLQSTFLDMFGDPVTNPMEWETTCVVDVTQMGTGSTPSRNNKNYFDGSIPWVKSTEVDWGTVTYTSECLSSDGVKAARLRLYPKGSIVLALYGQGKTRGKCAVLGIEATINQACCTLVPGDTRSTAFLFQFLKQSYHRLRGESRGGNQENLNMGIVRRFPIPFPPLDLQQRFAAIAESIEQQKASQRAHLVELDTLFASLQSRAFRGDL